MISGGASSNLIGGPAPNKRNLISGNDIDDGIGVFIRDTGTTKNVVEGNYIGTDPAGSDFLPNNVGVAISSGASGNVIGGTAPKRATSSPAMSKRVWTSVTPARWTTWWKAISSAPISPGFHALLNDAGVRVELGASENVIGGTEAGAGNLISGNINNGITVIGVGTTGNRVEGNTIGTKLDGAAALANRFGVVISGSASNNVIGGTAPGAQHHLRQRPRRHPHHDCRHDRQLGGGELHRHQPGRLRPFAKPLRGTDPLSASGNVIGGTVDGASNLISGNSDTGITIVGTGTSANQIEGNFIGTNQDGSGPLYNVTGVVISEGARRT